MQPKTGPTTSTKSKPKATTSTADKSQTKITDQTIKKGFLRDRIAKRKEAETNEFGDEEDENKPVDELTELASEDISEFSLYRESYVLTVAENKANVDETMPSEFLDITQMSTGQFESFAEVCFFAAE